MMDILDTDRYLINNKNAEDDQAAALKNELDDGFLSSPNFSMPNGNGKEFIERVFSLPEAPKRLEFNKGTTTLGFVFKGGVVIAVDSRATQGPFIASQTVKKVIEINPFLLGTMAGGAADCKFWERNLGRECRLYELRTKERISVAAASKMLQNTMSYYKGQGLSMGTMIAGWDKTGPNLYYVDSDGSRLKSNLFSVGSGSSYAYGVLDSHYKYDMEDDVATELGRRAIYHATYRDAYSGGTVNVYLVKEDGWKKISATDCENLHWNYNAEEKPRLI